MENLEGRRRNSKIRGRNKEVGTGMIPKID